LLKKSPWDHVWPHHRGLNFYIVIYREMLKKSFQEPLGQFQPNLAENLPGGLGFRFVQVKGQGSFGPQ